mgnify:CR=1 FL=1
MEPIMECSLSTTMKDTPSTNIANSTAWQITLQCQEVNQTNAFIFLQKHRVPRMKANEGEVLSQKSCIVFIIISIILYIIMSNLLYCIYFSGLALIK